MDGVPEAMWFCFFSSSVRRGFSSLSREGETDLDGDDMCAGVVVSCCPFFVSVKSSGQPRA